METGFSRLEMECSKCHLKFFAPQLKLDPKTDLMVCTNCSKTIGNGKIMIIRDRPPRTDLSE